MLAIKLHIALVITDRMLTAFDVFGDIRALSKSLISIRASWRLVGFKALGISMISDS